ncbi:hypothetical protein WA158_006258 [Blastocystis sp. Blastoise]
MSGNNSKKQSSKSGSQGKTTQKTVPANIPRKFELLYGEVCWAKYEGDYWPVCLMCPTWVDAKKLKKAGYSPQPSNRKMPLVYTDDVTSIGSADYKDIRYPYSKYAKEFENKNVPGLKSAVENCQEYIENGRFWVTNTYDKSLNESNILTVEKCFYCQKLVNEDKRAYCHSPNCWIYTCEDCFKEKVLSVEPDVTKDTYICESCENIYQKDLPSICEKLHRSLPPNYISDSVQNGKPIGTAHVHNSKSDISKKTVDKKRKHSEEEKDNREKRVKIEKEKEEEDHEDKDNSTTNYKQHSMQQLPPYINTVRSLFKTPAFTKMIEDVDFSSLTPVLNNNNNINNNNNNISDNNNNNNNNNNTLDNNNNTELSSVVPAKKTASYPVSPTSVSSSSSTHKKTTKQTVNNTTPKTKTSSVTSNTSKVNEPSQENISIKEEKSANSTNENNNNNNNNNNKDSLPIVKEENNNINDTNNKDATVNTNMNNMNEDAIKTESTNNDNNIQEKMTITVGNVTIADPRQLTEMQGWKLWTQCNLQKHIDIYKSLSIDTEKECEKEVKNMLHTVVSVYSSLNHFYQVLYIDLAKVIMTHRFEKLKKFGKGLVALLLRKYSKLYNIISTKEELSEINNLDPSKSPISIATPIETEQVTFTDVVTEIYKNHYSDPMRYQSFLFLCKQFDNKNVIGSRFYALLVEEECYRQHPTPDLKYRDIIRHILSIIEDSNTDLTPYITHEKIIYDIFPPSFPWNYGL